MSKVLLSCIVALCLMSVLLFVNVASAQDDVTTVTVPVSIDGITRTVTVAISGTNVLSVTVAPLSDTFQVTATGWLTALYAVIGEVQPNSKFNITDTSEALTALLDTTGDATYEQHWTPFVRQYRFAIHTCRRWLEFHVAVNTTSDGAAFLVGAYYALSVACAEQYQDAYVEMERIAHPLPTDRSK